MKSKHTQEPWPADMRGIVMTDGAIACGVVPDDCEPRANTARIVSCVNACAGMDDPAKDIQALKDCLRDCLKYVDICRKLTCGEGDIVQANARALLEKLNQ